jgi:hypothetical protein
LDYPVLQVDGVVESQDFSVTGLPQGVREVTFTSTKNPFAKKGIFKLIQLAVVILLRTPGRDFLRPSIGGGLRTVLAKPVGPALIPERRGEISVAVSTTEDQLISEQTGVNLPPEERLRSFVLLGADFNYEETAWDIVVRLVSEAGGAAEVLL